MQSTFPIEEATVRAPDSPFTETIESFLRSRHDLEPWTKRGYAKSLTRIAKRCPTIADFTADLVNAYIADKLAAGTLTLAHHDARAAKLLSAWCVGANILGDDPLEQVVVPRQPKRRRKPFTDEQVPVILEAARASQNSERDVTIVALALACALRKEELLMLRWPDDVDLKREVLWVRDAKTEAGVRCVPISRQVVALVDTYVKDWRPAKSAGSLFLNQHGDPFTYHGFSRIFSRIRRRLPADVDFKIHRARNTALTNWRRAGVDIATIAKLAGHTDISHTEHYLGDITPEEIAKVPDAFRRFYGRRVS
jgi:integrase